ncbi:aminopeptidase family protein P [Candidatus Dactylopiibacterium carminicum]|uniref:aminopeptidase family protein P n=1 Tax=Candidatus Dactylopiibacterium carminicum TaxID=857335 RepID=UPI001CC2BFCF|nr:aminopeptidase family protein P [Candidatus Dactylopiibacterium carminicum]
MRTDVDLISPLLADRPALPVTPVFEQPDGEAGESRAAKLARLRQQLAGLGEGVCFLSALDDIAWLLNLRGADVPFNPVFLAHALVDARQVRLFIDGSRVPGTVRARLVLDGVHIEPYAEATEALMRLPADCCVLIDPERTVAGLVEALPVEVRRLEAVSPVVLMKSRKNTSEQCHVRAAMEQDGAALCRFMAWFDEAVPAGGLDEFSVAARLLEERSRNTDFRGESFGTICAFRANAALPHYRAEPELAARIEGGGMLLLDSGGQYPAATTDITRMLPVGQPDAEQKRDCARVLRGVIALSRAVFPAGIGAPMVDAIARAPIWADGIDYGHGTGHGVGCDLHVHEAPQRIAYRGRVLPHNTLESGMITSIEPGIYRPGRWGVRIENLVLAREAASTEFGEFLSFETLTLCPIDLRCIDLAVLRPDEIVWLDAYHREVRRRLEPLLEGVPLAWLRARTAAVGGQLTT